jgi:hypothetical protein
MLYAIGMTMCNMDGCEDPVRALGKCRKHYFRDYYAARKSVPGLKEDLQAAGRAYRADPEHKEQAALRRERYSARLREAAFTAYGGACACCGEGHWEFLVIDHIDGGGRAHRAEIRPDHPSGAGGMYFYRWLKQNDYPPGFQVLCANCNMAKERKTGCPHQREETTP